MDKAKPVHVKQQNIDNQTNYIESGTAAELAAVPLVFFRTIFRRITAAVTERAVLGRGNISPRTFSVLGC